MRALVLELAVVHELADRRPGHRRDLDEVELGLLCQAQRILDAHDADLLALGTDEPHFGNTDPVVDAELGADGASSVNGQGTAWSWRPVLDRSTGAPRGDGAVTASAGERLGGAGRELDGSGSGYGGIHLHTSTRGGGWSSAQITPFERSPGARPSPAAACRACRVRNARTAATDRSPSEDWTASSATWSSSAQLERRPR